MKSNLFSKEWWICATERALKTVAQAVIASLGTSTMIQDVSWKYVIGTALLAGLCSYLTSIAGLPEIEEKTDETSKMDEYEEELKEASEGL